MSTILPRTILLTFLVGLAASESAGSEEESLRAVEPWSALFERQEVTYHFSIESTRPINIRASWVLSIQEREIDRGESRVRATSTDHVRIPIRIAAPAIKPGVILPLDLKVSLENPQVSVTKRLWVFPEDPFAHKQVWMENLKISLFDPGGKTADTFRAVGIPFRSVRQIESVGDGILVIGEGTSFREFRQLAKNMTKAATRGLSVLCLAPADGDLVVPGLDGGRSVPPSRLTLSNSSVVKTLGKHLDATAWPPDGPMISSTIHLHGSRTAIVGEVTGDTSGWPWVDIAFPTERGRLIICGFAVIEKWESGPTPRHLLQRILNELDGHAEAIGGGSADN